MYTSGVYLRSKVVELIYTVRKLHLRVRNCIRDIELKDKIVFLTGFFNTSFDRRLRDLTKLRCNRTRG